MNSDQIQKLQLDWHHHINKISSASKNDKNKWWEVVKDRYCEKHRYYHTLKHIYDMMTLFDQYKNRLQEASLVVLAIYFHDVIYDPKANDNEEKSAELFQQCANELKIEQLSCDKIKHWILLTKTHHTPEHDDVSVFGTEDYHYLLDFDMSVFAKERQEYFADGRSIRQEYIHVPDKQFLEGRTKILKSFLQVPSIYATQEMRSSFEEKARENIAEEIKKLISCS